MTTENAQNADGSDRLDELVRCSDCEWTGEEDELTCDNADEKRVINPQMVRYNLCPECRSYNIDTCKPKPQKGIKIMSENV